MIEPASSSHPVFAGQSELATQMRRFDWQATPLGPPDTWPQALRAVVRIVLTSRFAMWMGWGPERTFLYNDAYAAMTLGAKHPWALGRRSDEVWAEIWPQIGPRIERVIATGDATWDERLLLFLERSGYPEETYHTFSYSPIADDDGVIRGHLCVVTEETRRVIDERRLGALKELGSHLAVAQSDADVYRGVERAAGVAAADLPFVLVYEVGEDDRLTRRAQCGLPPGVDAPAHLSRAELDRLWPAGAPQRGVGPDVVWPARPWPTPIDAVLMTALAPQGQTAPAGLLVTGVNPHRRLDDTYRSFVTLFAGQLASGLANVRANEQERRRAAALADLDRAKSVFFSNVSHEFRTPLTLMLGPTEDAVHGPDAALRGDDLHMVYRNQLRLLKLVNALLDFSRIEAGRMTAAVEPTDLPALTADLAATFRAAIERGGLAFHVECPPLPHPVALDATLWEKVVLNLISNAFKFTHAGEIHVSVAADGDHAVLRVRDSGVGIPPAHLPHVFERFHRIEGARARTHEGSGIGLALVQDLVGLHGGSVRVESEPDRGTTFIVRLPMMSTLPAAPTDAPAARPERPNAYALEVERWHPHPAARPGTRAGADDQSTDDRPLVLIADDNADMRDYAARLLGGHWRVETTADGLAALDAIRARRPALVLTDVMMPRLDGFGLLQALRADPTTAAIPVIMLSARAGEEAQASALDAGADDYLVKPFSARELTARVASHLEHARVRRQAVADRDRFFGLLVGVPAIVNYLAGPDLVFAFVHPKTTIALGGREVLGRPLLDAFPEHRDQPFAAQLREVYRTGQPISGRAARADFHGPDGANHHGFWDYTYLPVRGADGEVEGVMTFHLDVTEQVHAQQRVEQATRAKDEFLAMLGHELRNPLAPILTATHLMRMKRVPEVERERAIIERQAAHLVRLVDDLLDVSRIARGKFDLKTQVVDIGAVVTQAIEQASPLLEARSQRLEVDVPVGLPAVADPGRLAQAIANLLTNAAKYSEPRSTVTLRAARQGPEIVIAVRDQGIGIDPEMLPQVFDMFVQEGQALDRSLGGLGLGLAIVRNVMALHGGSAVVSSEGRGRGSEFALHLPATAVLPAAGAVLSQSPSERFEGTRRVLVVDDNDDAARLLADVLRADGHQVWTASDGPSALQLAAEVVPHVGILDIGLPGMDGYELAARLREDPRLSYLQLVAVTGYGERATHDHASAAGFAAHFLKPVEPAELSEALRTLPMGVEPGDAKARQAGRRSDDGR